jgi:hypothetical protein
MILQPLQKVQGPNNFTLLWQSGGVGKRVRKLKQLIYRPGCGLHDLGFKCHQRQIFPFSKTSKLVLGPRVLGFFSSGKMAGLEDNLTSIQCQSSE